ncbi:MAG: PPOX class F420-dependent oxidoreductase [Pseudonocardiales bacterium]|nr:MAG: PPOX class F420-dependent oxidoreductase [Pseudonocardiales bacterium]
MATVIPDSHRDLLDGALYAHLATVRADGTPQVNPTWFVWDGELLWLTTTSQRRKYHNVLIHPEVALSVNDPEQPYRYLEVRGVVERIDPDPAATLFDQLATRYGLDYEKPIGDAADRVAIGVRPTHASLQ